MHMFRIQLIQGTRGGRGTPDVTGNADPETGYQIEVNGQKLLQEGTSAIAPLWAGLIANINQFDLPKNNQVLINDYIKCFPLYF